jgi:hypothetical protein
MNNLEEDKGISEAEVTERISENTRRLYGDAFS